MIINILNKTYLWGFLFCQVDVLLYYCLYINPTFEWQTHADVCSGYFPQNNICCISAE